MDLKAVDVFACPECGAELRVARREEDGSQNGKIKEGQLRCTQCPATFPILRSMPRFVSSDEYAASFGYQWNQFDKLQLDKFMRNDLSRERFLDDRLARTPRRPEGSGGRMRYGPVHPNRPGDRR